MRCGAPGRGLAVAAAVVLVAWTGEPAGAQPAPMTIRGVVTGPLAAPVAAAEVLIAELGLSTRTNAAGQYVLIVPSASVRGQLVQLRVRALGYRVGTVAVALSAGELSRDFELAVDPLRLDEIVVTGTLSGTESTRLGFVVERLDAASLVVPAANPLTLLHGRVPGALVVSHSGRPGTVPSIILRGPNSITAVGTGRGQEPLYIIDGVRISGRMADLDPQDIERIEVAKGAAASSLYGAEAGNGVVHITTRSGLRATEQMRFGIRSEVGMSDVEADFGIARRHALMLDETGTRFCSEAGCARTFDYDEVQTLINGVVGNWPDDPPPLTVDPGGATSGAVLKQAFQINRWPGRTYNAVEQFVRPQRFTMNGIDATGRVGGTGFYSSLSHTRQQGAIRFLDGYERFSGRLNVDQHAGPHLRLAFRAYVSRSTEDGLEQEDGGLAFLRLTRQPPKANLLARDQRGVLYTRTNLQSAGAQNGNPLYVLENERREDLWDRHLAALTLSYHPLGWLDVEGRLSHDAAHNTFEQFRDKGFRAPASGGDLWRGMIVQGDARQAGASASFDITARRGFGRALGTVARVGYSAHQRSTSTRTLTGTDLSVQGVRTADNAASQRNFSMRTEIRGLSVHGGIVADLHDRYIGDVLVRRDGWSLFGADNRWETYGRASLAWRVGEEPWFHVPNVGELKLRASYGTAGGVPAFAAQYETFSASGGIVTFGVMGNRGLRPEKIHELEYGADLALLDRLLLRVSRAESESRGQLLPLRVSAAQGFTLQWQNAGTMENRTWEASLDVSIAPARDLTWSSRITWHRTRTMIRRLDVPPFDIGAQLVSGAAPLFRIEEGLRYGTFFGRAFIRGCGQMPATLQAQCGDGGEFQVNDDGYVVWVGEGYTWRDGITRNRWNSSTVGPWGVTLHWGMPITLREHECLDSPRPSCPAQIVPLGNALPDFAFSIDQTVSYRRVSAHALFDAQIGQRVWNQGRHWAHIDFLAMETDQDGKTVETAKPVGYYYRAAPPDFSGLTTGGFYDLLAPNSRFVEDASFGRLRELSLTVHLGRLRGAGDWRLSVVGRNLFTVTSYRGWDPEVGVLSGESGSAAINRVDGFTFPTVRTLTLGIGAAF